MASVRVADLPGMRAFFDAVAGLVDAVNIVPGVPSAVAAAADRVRAEALGIGNDEVVLSDDEDQPPANAERVRAAMITARGNPGYVVTVDWAREL